MRCCREGDRIRGHRRATGREKDAPAHDARGGRADGQLCAGYRGDRPDAGRNRRRQGSAHRGAFANRRHPRTCRLLRDDTCVPPDHGGSAVDRGSGRPALAPERGRPGVDQNAQRRDPPRRRGCCHPGRRGRGGHRRDRPARRARCLRGAIQRDGRGLADGILRGPAGQLPEHRGAGGDPAARRTLLGVVVHRAGRDLPPAEWARSPEGRHGRGRPADGLPAGGRHPVHR